MTDVFNQSINFENWYYKNDETHVIFYTKNTFDWIKNDEFQHPILIPVYKKCAIIKNYQPSPLDDWFNEINPANPNEFDVVVELDTSTFVERDFGVIVNLNEIIKQKTISFLMAYFLLFQKLFISQES